MNIGYYYNSLGSHNITLTLGGYVARVLLGPRWFFEASSRLFYGIPLSENDKHLLQLLTECGVGIRVREVNIALNFGVSLEYLFSRKPYFYEDIVIFYFGLAFSYSILG